MIYFIEGEGTGLVKVGFTTIDPGVRLIQLQIGSPVPLVGLALMAGDKRRERGIHRRYRADHSHGEWFRLTAGLRSYIKAKGGPWCYAIDDRYLTPTERRARAEARAAEFAELRRATDALEVSRRAAHPEFYEILEAKSAPKIAATKRPRNASRFPWDSSDLMALRAQKRAKG